MKKERKGKMDNMKEKLEIKDNKERERKKQNKYRTVKNIYMKKNQIQEEEEEEEKKKGRRR